MVSLKILTGRIVATEVAQTRRCTKQKLQIILDIGCNRARPSMAIVPSIHSTKLLGLCVLAMITQRWKFEDNIPIVMRGKVINMLELDCIKVNLCGSPFFNLNTEIWKYGSVFHISPRCMRITYNSRAN